MLIYNIIRDKIRKISVIPNYSNTHTHTHFFFITTFETIKSHYGKEGSIS